MPTVEMFLYYDHSTDDECTCIESTLNVDMLVETVGMVVAETERKVLVMSDLFMKREGEGATPKLFRCRVDEIIKSTIISRYKIGEVDLRCEL